MFVPYMQPVQWASLFLSVVLIVLVLWVMQTRKYKQFEYLPWLIWFVHTAVYYSALAMRWETMAGHYGDWGSVLRLHGYLTIGYHLVYKLVQHYAIR